MAEGHFEHEFAEPQFVAVAQDTQLFGMQALAVDKRTIGAAQVGNLDGVVLGIIFQ
jgi:hypothetical protein